MHTGYKYQNLFGMTLCDAFLDSTSSAAGIGISAAVRNFLINAAALP
jgi:hypothetical protein